MYKEPIFLQPVFQERIWGGKKLGTVFNYPIPSDHTGEAWIISAHKNGPSVIENGTLAGKSLTEAWNAHGELFNKKVDNQEEYPLLVKILDAAEDLSVQVHPDDRYAREVEGVPYGKTECWYVLSAEEGAELVLGHKAQSMEEFQTWLDRGDWERLLRRIPVKAGDFIHVPSGTIHAIGKGIVIFETQQSSDITYRVYDYDRTDTNGQKRDLHLDRTKEVTVIPHENPEIQQTKDRVDDLAIHKLVEDRYFTVYHWLLNGKAEQVMDKDFLQVSVISGNAEIITEGKSFSIEKGINFILPYGITEYEIRGKAEFIVSHT